MDGLPIVRMSSNCSTRRTQKESFRATTKWNGFTHAGNSKGYNTKKSAFWRVVKKVAELQYPKDWYANVAWTNLYKIAPWSGGNPNGAMQQMQQSYCFELLDTEIRTLSPEYVIMLTSGWEWPFLKYLNGGVQSKPLREVQWNGYKTTLVDINGRKYIISQHPQGKNEWKHVEVIRNLMQ